jgi:hypothetical protein
VPAPLEAGDIAAGPGEILPASLTCPFIEAKQTRVETH